MSKKIPAHHSTDLPDEFVTSVKVMGGDVDPQQLPWREAYLHVLQA